MKSQIQFSLLGVAAFAAVFSANTSAQNVFNPGDLLITSAVYEGTSNTITVGQTLPSGSPAVANGAYFQVFNNDSADGSFGISAPVEISEFSTNGGGAETNMMVPTNVLVTSFSSKSELSLNLSQDGSAVTFMGYGGTTINQIDISNGNTPDQTNGGAETNSVTGTVTILPTYRAIAQLNANGTWTNSAGTSNTLVDTSSGDNPRAAILSTNGTYYIVGNEASTNVSLAGAQEVTIGGNPTNGADSKALGTFNIHSVTNPATGTLYSADKVVKDNNFRGETIFNNTLYITKGSGGNGIDTVYQVGAAGSLANTNGGSTNAITVLPGFDTTSAKAGTNLFHPFGLWFANASTLYVADEGTGNLADTTNGDGLNVDAGLEKWSLNSGTWHLDYTLTNGLDIGLTYEVLDNTGGTNNYYTSTDGLRQLAGETNSNGTVSLYALSSTASSLSGTTNAMDSGVDPNKLYAITDVLADTNISQAGSEVFTNLETAPYGTVMRGVSFTPQVEAVPEPSSWALVVLASLGGLVLIRARKWKS